MDNIFKFTTPAGERTKLPIGARVTFAMGETAVGGFLWITSSSPEVIHYGRAAIVFGLAGALGYDAYRHIGHAINDAKIDAVNTVLAKYEIHAIENSEIEHPPLWSGPPESYDQSGQQR